MVRPAELQSKLNTLKVGGMLLTLERRRAQAEDQRLGHVDTADEILASIERCCLRISGTGH